MRSGQLRILASLFEDRDDRIKDSHPLVRVIGSTRRNHLMVAVLQSKPDQVRFLTRSRMRRLVANVPAHKPVVPH